jgi:putative oxidoreductase
MHRQFAGVVTLIGRLLILPIFALASYNHLTDFAGTKGGASKGFENVGITLPDGMLTVLAGLSVALLVFGSLSLLLGWQARLGALCLALFLLGVTPTLHAFWSASEDQQRNQQIQFEKNMAMLGGLMFIMAYGAGPISMDAARAARRR